MVRGGDKTKQGATTATSTMTRTESRREREQRRAERDREIERQRAAQEAVTRLLGHIPGLAPLRGIEAVKASAAPPGRV